MNVLILGSGGREHAIAWKLAKSSQLENLFIAPGNAGTSEVGTNVDISVNDFEKAAAFCLENQIQILVVGPEDPLVNGVHDYFQERADLKHITVIGPKKAAAALEGSKDFAKEFMFRHNIPTAKYKTFTKETVEEGKAFLTTMKAPYVLKADGLAAGKGVLIIEDLKEAQEELANMLVDAKFGDASSRVVVEEFLDGIELSVFVLTDGKHYKILPNSKDYKRIGEGDTGLNTGGMGAVSPVPFADSVFLDKVESQIIIPTVKGLQKDNLDYQGFIFFGLISVKGNPYVIEYNVRMGDPETEVVMPRLKSDLLDLFEGIATGTFSEKDVLFDERFATTVMTVSGGYPEAYEKGKTIHGLDLLKGEETLVFHAGTKEENGVVKSNGGRVIAFTSLGRSINSCLNQSFNAINKINFDGMYYRKDIGLDLIALEEKK